MIKIPSTFKEYSAIYSRDPALAQSPIAPDGKDATPDAVAKYEAAVKERAHKMRVARETGDYSSLRVEGAGEPTLFQMRQLTADAYAYIIGHGGSDIDTNVLAFRYALRSVVNWPGAEVTLADHPQLGQIASLSFFDKLGVPPQLAVAIAIELGDLALWKANYRPS